MDSRTSSSPGPPVPKRSRTARISTRRQDVRAGHWNNAGDSVPRKTADSIGRLVVKNREGRVRRQRDNRVSRAGREGECVRYVCVCVKGLPLPLLTLKPHEFLKKKNTRDNVISEGLNYTNEPPKVYDRTRRQRGEYHKIKKN